ncbi:peptidase M24, structural domain-containing protein [Tricharina praecox]|uniref:peptidase M24, structural domain-containing protein n=1 Tax=Tricharina praecox TaxID=43433 RepID=UPI00221FED36|nr:peptidase M24, structural domain-containing protein [Tricharina praecox]KAI5843224.1 peptidase M24, structural domain-containing protein [Tricharina praecox]
MSDTEEKPKTTQEVDYSLNNPDTLTKYNSAAAIALRVLTEVTKAAVPGATILSLCQKGDELLEAETAKIFKGKKISKGIAFPTTVSPNEILTPYTPIASDIAEAAVAVKEGDILKIQLGAHIDGFPGIVSDTIVVGTPNAEQSDLLVATHHATEALLRLMLPAEVHPSNTEEKPYKPPTSHAITQTIQKIAEVYGCKIVESTTSFQIERNEIEGKKKLVLSPGENMAKSEGAPEVGDVWGVEMWLSKGSGKVKEIAGKRATLFKKTDTKTSLKRDSARKTYNEIQKKFGTFPFGLRQLSDERTAKMGVVECQRSNILRQYEVLGDKDGALVSRIYVTIAILKTGITKIATPPPIDLEKITSEHKIEDEELLKLLALPLKADKKKKKKAAKKETSE